MPNRTPTTPITTPITTPTTIALIAVCAAAVLAPLAVAQPDVPPGFTARKIAPLLDGQIPQLSAIDDPGGFGTGVVTATVANGIANFRLIEPSGVLRTIGVWNQAPSSAIVRRVRIDDEGVIDGLIHVTIVDQPNGDTHYLVVDSSGGVTQRWERTNAVGFDFDFTNGDAGNPIGAVLPDGNVGGGTQLAWMDTFFAVTVVSSNSLPPGRTDLDARGFQRDVTGLYGSGVLLADSDGNHDNITAIYELRDVLSGGIYRLIGSEVPTSQRFYGDLAIAADGDFGGVIYITERHTDEIQQVAPDGTHTTWATGFVDIDSLSITPDGSTMYVGDASGVWIIRAEGNEPGPVVLATDPAVPQTSQLTGDPITSFRIIFNEPVGFTDLDVTITNANGDSVGFDASGSNSQFMLIGLAEPLFGDTYTVTIADTVTSVATGEPLDGDNDGFSGGDAVLNFTHRCPGDFNADGSVNTIDVIQFLNAWTAGCP